MTEDQKRLQLKKETDIRDVQYMLKKAFPVDGELMEWLKRTTGYDKPFPDEHDAMCRAEGQRRLVMTIENMVKMSPEEILKYYKEKGRL